jgi:hypothetical protein
MIDEGAVLFVARPLGSELELEVSALGFALGESTYPLSSERELELWVGDGGIAVRVLGSDAAVHGLSLALARRLARSTGLPVRVLLATITIRQREFQCRLDDLLVAKSGPSTKGRWGTDLEQEYASNWSDLCDGKPHVARTALMDDATDTVLPNARCAQRFTLQAPASLGSRRLDDIAQRARFAERAVLTTAAGRLCVRITEDGATMTSFVDEAEAARLRQALGTQLTSA